MERKNATYRWFETEIDLAGISSPLLLRRAIAKGLDISEDELGDERGWFLHAFYLVVIEQERPYDGRRITFLNWSEFETKMPKYAKRIKDFLITYSKRHPHALEIFFT